MGRPRVDVTWRISGLFRDMFPAQIALLDAAVRRSPRATRTTRRIRWPPRRARNGDGAGSPASSAPRPAPTARASRSCSAQDGDRAAHRRRLSRRHLARLWRRRRRGHGAARRASPTRVAAADCWCTAATIPAAICSKARRTPPSSAASPRRPPRSAARPISIMLDTTDPQRPRARTARAALARIVRGRAINPRFIAGQMRHGAARRRRARRDRRPAGRFRRDDRRGAERAVRSACTTPISPTRACAPSCCARTPPPRARSPSGSTAARRRACGIRAATTSTAILRR